MKICALLLGTCLYLLMPPLSGAEPGSDTGITLVPPGADQQLQTSDSTRQTITEGPAQTDPYGIEAAQEAPRRNSDTTDTTDQEPTQKPGAWLDRTYRLPLFGRQLLARGAAPGRGRSLSADYRLQPGDTVRIVTWGGVTLNERLPVAPDGTLVVPGINALPVAELTRQETQDAVTGLLRGQFKHAGAVVTVEDASSVTLTVVGEVAQPGMAVIPGNGTVLDALIAAGGVLPGGSLRRIRIKEPGLEPATIDLYRLAQGEELERLRPLRPESLVVVPLAGPQVQVFGQTRRNFTFESRTEDATFAEVLALAGGFQAEADPHRIRLLREGPAGQLIALHDWTSLQTMTVADQDRLFVPMLPALDKRYEHVKITGEVVAPGHYPLSEGLTVGQLIARAGGTTPRAALGGARIIRHLREPRGLAMNEDVGLAVYEDLVTEVTPDTPVQALDVVLIPQRPALASSTLRVSINGAVTSPGSYPLLPDMTAGDLLTLAGSVIASAQVDQADLVRVTIQDSNRTISRQTIDLRPILNHQHPGPTLRNADMLVVRSVNDERIELTIEGEIANTGDFTLPAGTTLAQALEIAGGLTAWSFPEGMRFFRRSEAAAAAEQLALIRRQVMQAKSVNENLLGDATNEADRARIQATIANQEAELARMEQAQATGRMTGIDLQRILRGESGADFTLQDGDRMVIPKRPNAIRVLGQVMTPGSLRFEEGLKVEHVLQRSGGLTQHADQKRIFVVRANGTVVASAAFKGTSWDPIEKRWVRTRLERIILAEGDTVLVPPDLRYRISGMELAKDWSQILFQLATTVGTIAILAD